MSDDIEPGDFVTVEQEDSIAASARNRRRDPYDLERFAYKAMERPHSSMVAAVDLPESVAKSLATRRRDPFLTEEGRILIQRRRNTKKNENGEHLVTLYFTWVPFPEIPEQ